MNELNPEGHNNSLPNIISAGLLAGLLSMVPPVGHAQAASAARLHLVNGRRALAEGRFQDAKNQLELALKADPPLPEAYLQMGLLEFRTGRTVEAIQQYRKHLELQPASFDGHYHLALAYLRNSNLQEGLKELERAVALNPQHADATYNLGIVLLDIGRAEDALRRLRSLPESLAKQPDVAYNQVRAELEVNEVDGAKRDAERGARNFQGNAIWFASIGQLFQSHQQVREAMPYLKEAYRLQPGSDEIRRQLAAGYIEAREPDRALALLISATGAEDHYLSASAYLLHRRLSEALSQSRQALAQTPRDPRYLLQNARIVQRLGQHEKSLELLEQLSQLQPTWAEPYYSAGVSYYLLRRYTEARRQLDRALELNSNSERTLFLYAASLANEGRNSEGERYLRRAIALDPANARFQYHLGAMLLRDNRPAEARKAFEGSVRLRPSFALPHYQLGKLLAGSGQLAQAAQELEAAVRLQPDLAQAFYHLGRLYAKAGDRLKSAQALETFRQLKKEEATADQEFQDDLRKELEFEEQ